MRKSLQDMTEPSLGADGQIENRQMRKRFFRLALQLTSLACFLALSAMLFLFLLTRMREDQSARMVMLQSAMPYLLLPTYVILVFAILARRKLLVVSSIALVLCHVVLLSPEVRIANALPPVSKEVGRISLLSHNIHFDNWDPKALAESIKTSNADVLFLQEYTERVEDKLAEYDPFAAYPYSFTDPVNSAEGIAIYAKYPLSQQEFVTIPGYPDRGFVQQRVVMRAKGRDFALWNVHVNAPVAKPFSGWTGDLSQLDTRLEAETLDTIAAGDFNATHQHRHFRALLSNGYHEAAQDRGKWTQRTWPETLHYIPNVQGVLRLDHVLTRGNIRVVDIRTAGANGSDHLQVRATVALY